MIREAIVTTANGVGEVHIAPFGLIAAGKGWVIAPFRPSTTLDNLMVRPCAVANFTDDARIFAGCLTGRRSWPLTPPTGVGVPRLVDALSHAELAVTDVAEDATRPRFTCRVMHVESHAPFGGFNRAKAAVVEACILVSRLHMLPRDRVETELGHLAVVVGKTAGPEEAEAWSWLMDKVKAHYASA
jgi:hypothetical protein